VAFGRSVVLRFPAQYPFEDVVDFMIIEEPNSPLGLKLICCTGYHAGQTELVLPIEAKHGNGGLSVNWIKENWQKWVYCQCSLNEVSYIKHYPSNHGKEDA
jgi:hypothetical protein